MKENDRRFPYGERHIQCLWADPRHRPSELKTSTGESVEVKHPGEWNLESGPDFLNAILLIGKEKRRIIGDLEVHIHANDWIQHGHTDDPHFANTRFHIVFFQGPEISSLIQIPLQKTLGTDPEFSFETIDLTAFPYFLPFGDFPWKNMDLDKKIGWLECAGKKRMRFKSERMRLSMQKKEPEQVLWEELLAALGYKNNKAVFRRLAALLPLAQLRSKARTSSETYALLLGLSGLLPTTLDPKWTPESKRFIRNIWDFWWKQPKTFKELMLEKSDWTLAGIRPVNHPVRRLMAAAHYAFQCREIACDWSRLTTFPSNHWNIHVSWKTRCASMSLVGQSRANAMISNILIPFRAAAGSKTPQLEALPPEPLNSIIRQTAHVLFGPDHTAKAYKSALARQGLIHIFHEYLVTHRIDELKTAVKTY